ncbi:hypothetical protein GF327_02655 [Candidatus Woesearchaeota archaeon]|nr:hypothetical protein [Candidatus Woesearchaeota archaeon]
MSKKKNIVILHSFPTNSIILRGFYDFLEDYFNVYPIDLPGFIKKVPPLKEISLENYVKYTEEKIKEFNFDSSYIAGISMGFWVVANLSEDKCCEGILALEPYINYKSIRMSWIKRTFCRFFLGIILPLKLYKVLWKKRVFNLFRIFQDKKNNLIDIVLREIDAKTFAKTASLILSYNGKIKFREVSYVLLVNPKDTTLNTRHVFDEFKNNIKDLLIIEENLPHFPKDVSKEFFKKHIGKEKIKKVYDFFE